MESSPLQSKTLTLESEGFNKMSLNPESKDTTLVRKNLNFDTSIFKKSLLEDVEKSVKQSNDNSTSFEVGFFNCRTANQCIETAKKQPMPKYLYKNLILEKEITICVADTGNGKSIFAVQMADEISQNEKVIYLDLELSDKQFQNRYSENWENEHEFNDNLHRVVFKRRFDMPVNISYEDYFLVSLKELIEKTGAKVIIIDNMTRLISTDTDQARSAKPLMDSLNNLKFDFDLSMILLEHTKKTDPSRPIHLNDLQGSKMKANFADAVFTIGRSAKDKNLRYVKQLKVRSCELEFDSDNVIVYEIVKEDSFLQFRFIEFGNEFDHLKQQTEDDKTNFIESTKTLSSQGKTQRQISTELGISLGTVNKYLKIK